LPLAIRDDLAAKEKAYAGMELREIEETIIQKNVGGGRYDARVIEQKLRNGKVIRK
jgi:hypothetical protein